MQMSQRCLCPLPGATEYVVFNGKDTFSYEIKVMGLKTDYPDLSMWAQSNYLKFENFKSQRCG